MEYLSKDDKRLNFVKKLEMPNSPSHFKPDKIKSWDHEGVLLRGRDAMTNTIVNIKITEDMFRNIVEQYPKETKFLVDDYYANGAKNEHFRDTCNEIDRSLSNDVIDGVDNNNNIDVGDKRKPLGPLKKEGEEEEGGGETI